MFKRLYKNESSQESGTLLQLRNLINRRNISRDISGNFNAALDFLSLVTTSHILAAAMHFFRMSSRNDVPTLNEYSFYESVHTSIRLNSACQSEANGTRP